MACIHNVFHICGTSFNTLRKLFPNTLHFLPIL